MARPRIFVSSTYYDLKHIRSSLELFIESVGYEPVLSEKGDIAYHPDIPLDESCYREASSADIFVLVIGGRYGSATSNSGHNSSDDFYERYESITRKEYETAVKSEIPVYILIERAVHAEYQTYQKNRDNSTISYAHVDSVNIFKLIEYILSQPKNNPTFDFDQSSQIETWLREQWAGLFREMLRARSQQRQLAALTEQIAELKAVNGTLKNYLEAVMKKVDPTESNHLIEREDKRLEEQKQLSTLATNELFSYIKGKIKASDEAIRDAFKYAVSFSDVFDYLGVSESGRKDTFDLRSMLLTNEAALKDANELRDALDRPHFPDPTQRVRLRRSTRANSDSSDSGHEGG